VSDRPQTWHYGLVARWWAEFNVDGPEIDYFQRFVEQGQPALDLACGTGRLLIPYLRAGLDVDGCDVSPDMLAHCRERGVREGVSPTLYAQALHELDLPRRYRTIFICGGFGLGGNRDDDVDALRRIYEHLEPGGVLVLDNEVPYAAEPQWKYWTREGRALLPRDWPDDGTRQTTADGSELALRSRMVELDPLAQRVTMGMRAELWRDGVLEQHEEQLLRMTLYFKDELVLLLERTGFAEVSVRGGYDGGEPTPDHEFLVFVARK